MKTTPIYLRRVAIEPAIQQARDILVSRGFRTGLSQGHLLIDCNRHSAREVHSICAGRGLEFLATESVAGATVARFGVR